MPDMIDLSGNISLAFGAQYKAEDTASYILYKFDKRTLTASAVSSERFAAYLGLNLNCDYVFGGGFSEGLGVIALEPQSVYTGSDRLELGGGSIVIERSIVDECDYNLYNYAVMSLISHYLFSFASNGGEKTANTQLSFGLSCTLSTKNAVARLSSLYENYSEGKFDKISNFTDCLIMPKNRFKVAANALFAELGLNRNSVIPQGATDYILDRLSEQFCVPQAFVFMRLVRLNYI